MSATIRPIMVVPPEKQFRPIMVVPHGRAIPKPILVPPQATPATGLPAIPKPILTPPPSMNSPQVRAQLTRRVEAGLRTAQPTSAPMNPERFASCDVTPMNEFGVRRTAYNIDGELWVASSPVVPNGKPQWFDLGAMPKV
jgi:hypothetical protein